MPYRFSQSNVRGKVMELKTRIGLAGVRVDNLSNRQTAVSNNDGNFIIPAKNGDLLVFKVFAYKADTLLLTDLGTHEVFLEPVTNQLKQVNINSTNTKNLNTYYDPRFHGQSIIYSHDDNLNYKGGITWRLWWWKKDRKKKDKLADMQRRYDAMDKIYAVFQPSIISQYIPLSGQDMDNFITLYTPSPETVSKKGFNLSNYLNDCLKKYQALPPDKRVPEKLSE